MDAESIARFHARIAALREHLDLFVADLKRWEADEDGGARASAGHATPEEQKSAWHCQENQLLTQANLLAQVADAIIVIDLDLRIRIWNAAAERIYGWSAAEAIGQPIGELIETHYAGISSGEAFHLLFASGSWSGEIEQRRRDGSFVPIQSSVTLLRNADGAIVGIVTINRDISERRHTEWLLRAVNSRLEQMIAETQRRTTELIQINEMHDLLQVCQNRAEAAEVIGLCLAAIFPEHSGYLAVRQPGLQILDWLSQWGEQVPASTTFTVEECWALRRGQLHVVKGAQGGPRCPYLAASNVAYACCLPLSVQGEIYGVLHVAGASELRSELVISVGDAIKLTLANVDLREVLREQATHDPLTGLFNRRYLEVTLPRELYRAQREDGQLCVAMLDIDHFKHFNDRYGHEAGDVLLREVAWLFRTRLRKSDIACRYGGEEFLLVLPGSSVADTVERLEQICALVRGLQIDFHGRKLGPVSISVGIAAHTGDTSAADLLHAADTALYAAKEAGRDRIVVAR